MMKRKKVGEMSFVEVLITRHGFMKARKTLMFVACWMIVCEDLGRAPETVEEYCQWWKRSRAQGYREQATFRECVAMETPTPLWLAWREEVAVMAKKKQADKLARQVGTMRYELP